jgi:hypothetical protein
MFNCQVTIELHRFIINKTTLVQGSVVPGSGLRNIEKAKFLTVHPEPAKPES